MTERLLLKEEARSLCPDCCREIPARTFAESNGVFMEKKCPEHGCVRAMVERDAMAYRMLMNASPTPRPPDTLVIPVTHRCNLHCTMCFLPDDGVPDPPPAAIQKLIDEFGGAIVFSGGEPTVRRDLPELIAYAAKRGRNTCIATNGLLFENSDYVTSLADAGLGACLFSFNSLSDRAYEQIEGQPLLDRKRKALENVLASPILPRFSSTLVAGCNENEVPELKRFFLSRGIAAPTWRIRTHAALGRHHDTPNLWMSDLLQRVCDAWSVDREELLLALGAGIDYHGTSHAYFTVPFREEATHTTNTETPTDPLHKPIADRRLRACGLRVFAWPDITNVDLDETAQTGIWHVGPGGEPMPFIEAVIRNLYAPDWNWPS